MVKGWGWGWAWG